MNGPKGNIGKSILLAAAVAWSTGADATLVDLTTANSSGEINGGIFANPVPFLDSIVSGSGVFGTFSSMGYSGNQQVTEQGYNSSARGMSLFNNLFPPPAGTQANFDETDSTHNRDIQVSEVPRILGDGSNGTNVGELYRQFVLDINEPDDKNAPFGQYLSLDDVKIYVSPTAGNHLPAGTQQLSGNDFSALGDLVYEMNGSNVYPDTHSVLLDSRVINSGSGRPDMILLIPDAFFTDPTNYVYLYSHFGSFGCTDDQNNAVPCEIPDPKNDKKTIPNPDAIRDYRAQGGFEEWGNPGEDYCVTHPDALECVGSPQPPEPPVPEIDAVAGSGALTFLGGALVLMGERRRRKEQ